MGGRRLPAAPPALFALYFCRSGPSSVCARMPPWSRARRAAVGTPLPCRAVVEPGHRGCPRQARPCLVCHTPAALAAAAARTCPAPQPPTTYPCCAPPLPAAGPILAQAVVPVYPTDRPEQLAARVLKEEHKLYPRCVAALCEGRITWRHDGVPILWSAH